MPGLDPFKLTEVVERNVVKTTLRGIEKRYYRFRGGRWYGGIATGDVVGCNLRCKFCWSWRYSYYDNKGFFKTPREVFEILDSIADRNRYRYIRLSGGEPTIGFKHLLELLELIEDSDYVFILETNGLLIGRHGDYAKRLVEYNNLAVRVSFKGCTPGEFEYLTGASREFYEYQFKALENLYLHGMKPCRDFYPAVMLSFSTGDSYLFFKNKLRSIDPRLVECIDEEYVILYPHVRELLEKNRLKPRVAYDPSGIPESMI